MQSVHYNHGSIKLTRERSTMVNRWDLHEVAKWIAGLAGVHRGTDQIFLEHKIDGQALTVLTRDDLIRMGIKQIDQQMILLQSVDLLSTLVNRLSSETLALLFMRIHCSATVCFNMLRRHDDMSSSTNKNYVVMHSPDFYVAITLLSDAIIKACHWLGRLPFIETSDYIELRRQIIKSLVQIRLLLRNLRMVDTINMPKTKLIREIDELRTHATGLIRRNKDSLFSSDCYLTRVNLRRPTKDDMNIEYTTMPDYTHVISSIQTESMGYMGTGFNAINIGDEIIEINNQVVLGWDAEHFLELLQSQSNEIYLLVKKMPRHNDDEVYAKRMTEWPLGPRKTRARGVLERLKQQERDQKIMLLEQEGEIEVESDDETLYHSKRSSQCKRDAHLSLPDLTETDGVENIESSVSTVVTTTTSNGFKSPLDLRQKKDESQRQSSSNSSPNSTPKSQKKASFEGYISTLFRPKQDAKNVLPGMDDYSKDHPQLVNVKRIYSMYNGISPEDGLPSSSSTSSLQENKMNENAKSIQKNRFINKSNSQSNLPSTNTINNNNNQNSSPRSSLSNIFKNEQSGKFRIKHPHNDNENGKTFQNDSKHENGSVLNNGIVTNKPPLVHSESRKNSSSFESRRPKRMPSYRKISCKDLGKGDCEGFLHRYLPKGTLSLLQWRLYWCVLKGGTLYIYKSKDDNNQNMEIKLEGKNVSPAPEKKKYAFRITDENKYREYFYCSSRDEMAKWMNKMGLAAINFNIDDTKIGGFNKGFIQSSPLNSASQSRESSPSLTPTSAGGGNSIITHGHISGDSENESDSISLRDSPKFNWAKLSSFSKTKQSGRNSSLSDTEHSKDKTGSYDDFDDSVALKSFSSRGNRSSSTASITSFAGQLSPPEQYKSKHNSNSPSDFDDVVPLNAAPRLSDSDSSTDQQHQSLFNISRSQEHLGKPVTGISPYPDNKILQSSGGFMLSQEAQTPNVSCSSGNIHNNNAFSSSLDEPCFCSTTNLSSNNGGSSELNSPLWSNAPYVPPNLSPIKPSVYTPATPLVSSKVIRTNLKNTQYSPLYVSVYSGPPPNPTTKATVSSSIVTPPTSTAGDTPFFSRRSPSPTTIMAAKTHFTVSSSPSYQPQHYTYPYSQAQHSNSHNHSYLPHQSSEPSVTAIQHPIVMKSQNRHTQSTSSQQQSSFNAIPFYKNRRQSEQNH